MIETLMSKKAIEHSETYANLFVGFIEQQFFDKFDGTKPELYRRYIDDCFGATSCSRQELDYFIASVNSFHPALKYTWVVSECSIEPKGINFLSKLLLLF